MTALAKRFQVSQKKTFVQWNGNVKVIQVVIFYIKMYYVCMRTWVHACVYAWRTWVFDLS